MEVESKVVKVEDYDLLEKEIESIYENEKVGIKDKALDYDSFGKDVELILIRVPKKFDIKKLEDKLINSESNFVEALNVDKEWQLTESVDDAGSSQSLLPVQNMDGLLAPAPLKVNHYLKITRKIDTTHNIEAAKRMRDEQFETPKQKLGLKMHFHPVGFFTGEEEEAKNQIKVKKDKKVKKHKKAKENEVKEEEQNAFNVTNDSEVKVEDLNSLDTSKKDKKKKKKSKKE